MAISPINLGSFYTNSNGATVSSGISSGLNTESIVKALTASQESQIAKLQDQVDVNTEQSTTLTSLKQTLTALQSSLGLLSNPQSFDTTTNVFNVRIANITSNTSQSASNYLTTTVASGTASGTYSITDITSLATFTTQETSAFTLDDEDDAVVTATATAGFLRAGAFIVNGQTITLAADDNLSDIADKFNTVSVDTGIKASVLQTAPGQYKLVFTSTQTGEDARFDMSDSGTVSSDPSGVFANISFAAVKDGNDAHFKLNNIDITRPTNAIDDLISGVTLNLTQDTTTNPGANITIKIEPDTESIVTAVGNFAINYNKFLSFYTQQTERDVEGAPKETAILYNDTTLLGIYNEVTSIAASIVKGLSGSALNSFESVGISFTDYAGDDTTPAIANILSVDNSKLKSNLLTNFDGVGKVFGDNFSSPNADLIMYKGPTDSQGITNFTLDFYQSADPKTYTATYLGTDGSSKNFQFTATPLSSGGVSLLADPDSEFAGMTLIYVSDDNAFGISATVTQGLMTRMKSFVDTAVKASDGMIVQDQNAITEKNTALQKQIDTVTEQMTKQRDALLQKYSQLEAAISKANSVLNLLNAQQLASQT